MPIVTERQAQERKRRLWPLGLAVGAVLLVVGIVLIVPVVQPVDIRIGTHRFEATAVIAGEDIPWTPSDEYMEYGYPSGRTRCRVFRLGRLYWFITHTRGVMPPAAGPA